jgi:hypothetical protein
MPKLCHLAPKLVGVPKQVIKFFNWQSVRGIRIRQGIEKKYKNIGLEKFLLSIRQFRKPQKPTTVRKPDFYQNAK